MNLRNKEEAEAEAVRQLDEAFQDDRIICAAFSIDEDGTLHCRRTTWGFPIERMKEAVQLLSRDLERAVDENIDNSPLPRFNPREERPDEQDP